MKELWSKIKEALISALPITAIVFGVALLPVFDFSATTLIAFGIGAVMLILVIFLSGIISVLSFLNIRLFQQLTQQQEQLEQLTALLRDRVYDLAKERR